MTETETLFELASMPETETVHLVLANDNGRLDPADHEGHDMDPSPDPYPDPVPFDACPKCGRLVYLNAEGRRRCGRWWYVGFKSMSCGWQERRS